ncbi:hypothetical protein D3C84_920640 [compost metagenome]
MVQANRHADGAQAAYRVSGCHYAAARLYRLYLLFELHGFNREDDGVVFDQSHDGDDGADRRLYRRYDANLFDSGLSCRYQTKFDPLEQILCAARAGDRLRAGSGRF